MIVVFQQRHFATRLKNNKIKINKVRKKQIKNKRNYKIKNKQTKNDLKIETKEKCLRYFVK